MKSQNINKQNAAMECQPKKKVSDRLTKAEKKDEQASLVDRLSSIDIASNSGGSHMATRSRAQQNCKFNLPILSTTISYYRFFE